MSSLKEQDVFASKWSGFVSALWLMLFSSNFAFANYSEALKEVLAINQSLLNGLIVARDVGDSCGGIVGGILTNHLSPRALLCICAGVGLLGFGAQWLVVAQVIDPLPYWTMVLALMGAGIFIALINAVIFPTSVRNFSRNRGPVAGLLKACMGLSGAVFSVLCSILFSNAASAYLLMLVVVSNTFCLLSAKFFQPVPPASTKQEEELEEKSIFVITLIGAAIALYTVALSFFLNDIGSSSAYSSVSVTILLVMIASPALIPSVLFLKMKRREYKHCSLPNNPKTHADLEAPYNGAAEARDQSAITPDIASNKGLTTPLIDTAGSLDMSENRSHRRVWCFGKSFLPFCIVEDLGKETPTLSLFRTWHYYVLYFSLFCGCGVGNTFTNNLGQVGESFGFSSVNLFVSLFGLGNFFGRILAGNVSELCIRAVGLPRLAWMGIVKVPMIGSCVWLATGSVASLYVGSLVVGFSCGACVSLAIPIVSELYGLKHFSTNFVLTVTYMVTSSYVFSSVAGYLYDRQASTQGSLMCYGSSCYSTTFEIFAGFLAIALAFDVILTLISRPLYQKLQAMSKNLLDQRTS